MNTMYHNSLMNKYPEFRDPEICVSVDRIEFYFNRRSDGMSHNFAAMLACQRAPGANTEQIYFEGRHTLAQQFEGNEGQLEAVVAAARAKGYNPSYTDIYEPNLADDMGDPQAFIKPCGGTTEYRRKLEAAGKSSFGLIKVKGRKPVNPPANVPLAQDIVDDMLVTKLRENPDLAAKVREKPAMVREMRGQIVEQHGYSDAKRAGGFSSPYIESTKQAVDRVKPVRKQPRLKRKKS